MKFLQGFLPHISKIWILDFIFSVGNMGAENSQADKKLFDWVPIQPHRYLNTLTGQTIDHHQITTDTLKVQMQYNRRMRLIKSNIVQLLYYRKSYECGSICSNKKQMIDIFIEGDLQKLSPFIKNCNGYNKCFCHEIMKGFEILKSQYGPFQVSIDMVWYDKNNIAKVWLNKNPFLNDFTPVKQSLMVLQIKQILLKLNCNCNLLKEEQLIFQNLTNKSTVTKNTVNISQTKSNVFQNPQFSFVQNQSKMREIRQKNRSPSFSTKSPFYYPPQSTQNKNYAKVIRPTSYFSQVPKAHKSENLDNSQKIFFSRANGDSHQVNHHHHPISQQRKNHSSYLPSNSKQSSTPKISFLYGVNSPSNRTPVKQNYNLTGPSFFSVNSNNSSPQSESKNNKPQLPFLFYEQEFGRKNAKKVTLFQNQYPLLRQPRFSEAISYSEIDTNQQIQSKPNIKYQTRLEQNKYQTISALNDINTTSISNLTKKSVISNQIEGSQLQQVRETITVSEPSIQQMCAQPNRKNFTYENSQTERIWLQRTKQDLFQMRNSFQSQKMQGKSMQIQYQMPQKTKVLIKKYLSATQSKNLQVNSIHEANMSSEENSHNKLNEQDFLQNNKYEYKNTNRQKLKRYLGDHENEAFLKSAKTINIQRNSQLKRNHDVQEQEQQNTNLQRITSTHTTGSYLQQHQKEQLKRQMELVFNFAPQEEEENKIKKKVAQKKAIFADLKAEATKILQK